MGAVASIIGSNPELDPGTFMEEAQFTSTGSNTKVYNADILTTLTLKDLSTYLSAGLSPDLRVNLTEAGWRYFPEGQPSGVVKSFPLLHLYAYLLKPEFVIQVSNYGADYNALGGDLSVPLSALLFAVYNRRRILRANPEDSVILGSIRVIEGMIATRGDINASSEDLSEGILHAAVRPHPSLAIPGEIVTDKHLLTILTTVTLKNLAMDERGQFQCTPLLLALLYGSADAANTLIIAGADPSIRGESAFHTAILLAIMQDMGSVIENLARKGVDLNEYADAASGLRVIPLHFAAANNKVVAAEALIKSGASIEQLDAHNKSAVRVAAEFGSIDMVSLLIRMGARVDRTCNRGFTPLWATVTNELTPAKDVRKNAAVVAALLKAGANFNMSCPFLPPHLQQMAELGLSHDSQDADFGNMLDSVFSWLKVLPADPKDIAKAHSSHVETARTVATLWQMATYTAVKLLPAEGTSISPSSTPQLYDQLDVLNTLLSSGIDRTVKMEDSKLFDVCSEGVSCLDLLCSIPASKEYLSIPAPAATETAVVITHAHADLAAAAAPLPVSQAAQAVPGAAV